MRLKLLLLHNPRAGTRSLTHVEAVIGELRRRGAQVVARSLDAGTPTSAALADAEAFAAVIAAGGDGTLRSVLTALGDRPVAVGMLPAGTGNVFAHEVGLPAAASDLAEVLLNGPAVEIRGGRVNGQPFFLMAGAGFDGDVIHRLDQGVKSRFGKLAYAAPVLRAMASPGHALSVTVDDRTSSADWVIAARSARYGGHFLLAAEASLLRCDMVAVLFRPVSRADRIVQLARLAAGRLAGAPGVEHVACRSLRISAARPVPVEVDGDPFGATPVAIDCEGPKVRVIVPSAYATRPVIETPPAAASADLAPPFSYRS